MGHIKTMTNHELADAGVNPDSPMSSARIKGSPLSARRGNNLISRSAGGQISVCIGYFEAHQAAARRAFSERIVAEVEKSTFGALASTRSTLKEPK